MDVFDIVNTRHAPVLPSPSKTRTRLTCDRNKVLHRAKKFEIRGHHSSPVDMPLYSTGFRRQKQTTRFSGVRRECATRLPSVTTNATPVFVSGPYVKVAYRS